MFRSLTIFVFALSLGFVQSGCSAYKLGGPKPTFSTIEISPVRNSTTRPGMHLPLEQKLRESFQGDPRLRVGAGDAKLETEVIEYSHKGLTTSSTDAYTYTSYNILIKVRCTLTTQNGQKVLFKDREFSASATLQPSGATATKQATGDGASEERSIAPGIFAELAAQIREAATTSW
jgi:hypothetical protein